VLVLFPALVRADDTKKDDKKKTEPADKKPSTAKSATNTPSGSPQPQHPPTAGQSTPASNARSESQKSTTGAEHAQHAKDERVVDKGVSDKKLPDKGAIVKPPAGTAPAAPSATPQLQPGARGRDVDSGVHHPVAGGAAVTGGHPLAGSEHSVGNAGGTPTAGAVGGSLAGRDRSAHTQAPVRTFTPPAGAKVAAGPAGSKTFTAGDGRQWQTGSRGQLTSFSKPGMQGHFRDDGRLSQAHFDRPDHSQMDVHRGFYGQRQVVVVRPDHSRLVSNGSHYGYVERPLPRRDGYVSRTYVVEQRTYVRVYREYYYHNVQYYRYVPAYYYQPRFYGWAYNPWRVSVVFSWGWFGRPWYGYYGGYFAPAPVYPSASLWLTDYLLAQDLELAYENRQQAQQLAQPPAEPPQAAPPNTAATLSPEVKQLVAEEVKRQLAEEQAAGQAPAAADQYAPSSEQAPPALDPQQRTFIVSQNMDVLDGSGQECALTPGDILFRTGETITDGGKVAVNVLSAKAGDCPANTGTSIGVADLQEMHNHFREQLDGGLKTLADNQGQGGIPQGPAGNAQPVAAGQADPEPGAEQALNQQQAEADQLEGEVTQAANTAPGSSDGSGR
jgi:hypothetical protein